MRKTQIIFQIVAIILAAVGVYASSIVTTYYYIPFYQNRTTLSCDIKYSAPCSDTGSLDCIKTVALMDEEGNAKGTFSVLIGKRIGNGYCQSVVRTVNE